MSHSCNNELLHMKFDSSFRHSTISNQGTANCVNGGVWWAYIVYQNYSRYVYNPCLSYSWATVAKPLPFPFAQSEVHSVMFVEMAVLLGRGREIETNREESLKCMLLPPNPTGCPKEGTRCHEHTWTIKHRDATDWKTDRTSMWTQFINSDCCYTLSIWRLMA